MEHNFCDTCGDYTLLVKGNCSSCDAKARAERDSWEQSNVCSRCNGKLDQRAIEVNDGKAVCAACQTADDSIF